MKIALDKKQLENWHQITEGYWIDENNCASGGAFGKVFEGYSATLQSIISVKVVPKGHFDEH